MRSYLRPVLAVVVVLQLVSCATASGIGRPDALVGVWKIEQFCDKDEATGKFTERFGPTPVGYFVYTQSGHVTIQIMAKPNQRGEGEYIGYFGTYKVDPANSTVVHHVEGGTLPDYVFTDQVRKYQIKQNTLSIGLEPLTCRILHRVG